jgi:hypothetical protein
MKRHLRPVVAFADTKKMLFLIFCCAVLMLLSAPAWATALAGDPCNSPTIGQPATPVGNAYGCGVLITITGTSGHLVATVTGGGTANGNPYDLDEDELIGIQNNSSVTIGAIRLSSPNSETGNLFAFDGDGPCNQSATDCYNGGAPASQPQADPLDYEGPNNNFVGISSDYTTGTITFVTPIPPTFGTWFGMENTPSTVVSIGETQPLVTGATNVFPFGPFTCSSECTYGSGTWTENATLDDAQFRPIGGVTGADYWTVLPVPVCAGPVGESPFGPYSGTPSFGFTTGDFGLEAPLSCQSYGPPGFVTNFGPTSNNTFGALPYPNVNSLACVPYSDYSSSNDPVGVEFERDCIGPDCGSQSLQWTMQLDYDIDGLSIAGPIGGPAICFAPGVPGPTSPNTSLPYATSTTDCSINAITSYTGAIPGEDPPPPKGGGTDGKSVFVSLFSPAQSETNPIPAGVTVGFPGFEFPTSNTASPSCSPESAQYLLFPSGKQVTITAPANCLIKFFGIPVPWALVWDYTTTSNTPITNLSFCPSVSSGTCPGVSAPWVHLSLIPVANCGASFTGQNPLPGPLPKLAENFVNLGGGQYAFNWEPGNDPGNTTPKGCEVSPVLQFDTGTFVSPAVFVYSY